MTMRTCGEALGLRRHAGVRGSGERGRGHHRQNDHGPETRRTLGRHGWFVRVVESLVYWTIFATITRSLHSGGGWIGNGMGRVKGERNTGRVGQERNVSSRRADG